MDEIGSILQDAREMKGLTIADVYEELRISKKFLRALEEGQYERLPSQTHIRGYLNKYARFLDLDPEPLLGRYEALKQQRPLPTPPPPPAKTELVENPIRLPEPEAGTFFEHANIDIHGNGGQEESDWIGRLIVLALIIAIGMIGWRFSPLVFGDTGELSTESLTAAVTDVLNRTEEEPVADSTSADQPSVLTNDSPTISSSELITSTSRTAGSTTNVNEPPPTPTRFPLPATMETIELNIDMLEQEWILVEIDGATVYEGQAQKGEQLNWVATTAARLRTGNAAATFVTINDIELGRLGNRGQLFDETWETTQ